MAIHYVSSPMDRRPFCGKVTGIRPQFSTSEEQVTCGACVAAISLWEQTEKDVAALEANASMMAEGFGLRTWD